MPIQVPEKIVKDNMTFGKSAIENSWVISGNGSLNVLYKMNYKYLVHPFFRFLIQNLLPK